MKLYCAVPTFWLYAIFGCLNVTGTSSEACTTPAGEKATCLPLASCPNLNKILTSQDKNLRKFLEASKCPLTNADTYCCGTYVTDHNQTDSANQASTCTTPNGETAVCTSLFSCSILQKSFTSNDRETKKFVIDSVCKEGTLMVCCGSHASYVKNQTQAELARQDEAHRQYVINELLDDKAYCGNQHTDDYHYNKTAPAVDEFPWMVYIPKKNSYCTGVLINSQYVLTTQECMFDNSGLEMVRLGQYYVNQSISCIEIAKGQEDCTTVLEVPVNTLHVKYLQRSRFVLIRLKEKVYYSDYIRPICLPLLESERLKTGYTITTSGWGQEVRTTSATSFSSKKPLILKKRMKHTILNNNQCELGFDNLICAATIEGNNFQVCPKDNGAPLTYKYGNNWFVGALITGMDFCTAEGHVRGERITQDTLNQILLLIEP